MSERSPLQLADEVIADWLDRIAGRDPDDVIRELLMEGDVGQLRDLIRAALVKAVPPEEVRDEHVAELINVFREELSKGKSAGTALNTVVGKPVCPP